MKIFRKKGFTLVEIMIVVAIIGLLAAIAIPNFVRARERAVINSCVANLRQIDGAKQIWAIDLNKDDTAEPGWSDLVSDYIRATPSCKGGGSYTIGKVDTEPTCSVGNEHTL